MNEKDKKKGFISKDDGTRVILVATFSIPHKGLDFLPDAPEWTSDITTTKNGDVIFNNFGIVQDLEGNDIAYWRRKNEPVTLYYMTDCPDKQKSDKAFELIKGMSIDPDNPEEEVVFMNVKTEVFPHMGIGIKGEQK
jgi:hypothetical protein